MSRREVREGGFRGGCSRRGTIVRAEAAGYTPLTGTGQKLRQLAQFVARMENNAGKLLTMSRRPRRGHFKRCFRPNLPILSQSASPSPRAHTRTRTDGEFVRWLFLRESPLIIGK